MGDSSGGEKVLKKAYLFRAKNLTKPSHNGILTVVHVVCKMVLI